MVKNPKKTLRQRVFPPINLSVIESWCPYWALPIKVKDFFQHVKDSRENKTPISQKKWERAVLSLMRNKKFHICLKTGKVLHTFLPKVPEGMMRCEACGHVWDGCAQCNCEETWEMMGIYPLD